MPIVTLYQLKFIFDTFVCDTRRSLLFLGCCVIMIVQWCFKSAIEENQPTLLFHVVYGSWTEYILVILLFLIGAFGCFAAFTGHSKSLTWFFYLLMIHYVIMGSLLISFVNNPNPSYRLEKSIKALQLRMGIMEYKGWGNADLTFKMDTIQLKNKCCGAYNPFDWDRYRPSKVPSQAYPYSCCSQEKAMQRSWQNFPNGSFCHWVDIYTSGCVEVMYQADVLNYSKFIFYLAFQSALSLLALTIRRDNRLFQHLPIGIRITEKGTVISMVSTQPATTTNHPSNHSAPNTRVQQTFIA